MRLVRILLKIVIPFLILGGGFLGMRALVMGRPTPTREVKAHLGPLVETVTVAREDRPVEVRATGTVQASHEVTVTPQINGKIVAVSPNLVEGGFLRQGDVLFEIESADFELLLEKARAALAAARFELTRMESQAEVARAEWERLGLEGGPPNPLVLYEPQLENARSAVGAAEATLKQAELDLDRTVVRAPFNARVRSEQVEPGQYVRSGTSVAVLVGTDTAEVVVPLPHEELRWLTIPRHGEDRPGSSATVRLDTGNGSHEWQGRITRSLGEVDPRGRMTRAVVEVPDPFGLQGHTGSPELQLGMFVQVAFQGRRVSGVVAVPRRALRDGSTVWLVDSERKLRIRSVEVLRLESDEALVAEGLEEGDRLVVTSLTGAADQMTVRLTGEDGAGVQP